MSSSNPRHGAEYERGDPEDTYDAFDYEDETGNDDVERCISEGILRQEDQPQAQRPEKNSYMQAISSVVKRGKKMGRAERVERVEPASKDGVLGASRRLISHDHRTALSPELAAAFDSEVSSRAKWIKERANKNAGALEELLRRVPDSERDLQRLVTQTLLNERQNEKEAGKIGDFMEEVKKKDQVGLLGRAWNILKGKH
ncbi:hypothetical protein EPUS_04492 [Endocarpon pusillum Z07020]|uniref:Uncharacterized protein n=1 Tax=Endocarpon pusillum (strain Z07020 / HMAS-L-300199) TaxID=1263415 RepID=U1HFG4_ENDPU|nr:uncharacterized protein EPUS_04492 [Endocarpon pusillum Z07020]ERF68840.1 hypothetical protein EPUS_04492 [Endocarpon pusillum Z07020]